MLMVTLVPEHTVCDATGWLVMVGTANEVVEKVKRKTVVMKKCRQNDNNCRKKAVLIGIRRFLRFRFK